MYIYNINIYNIHQYGSFTLSIFIIVYVVNSKLQKQQKFAFGRVKKLSLKKKVHIVHNLN